MTANKFYFVYPGDLNTRTGGYRYDKRLIEELRVINDSRVTAERTAPWEIELISLDGDFPFPNKLQLETAALKFAAFEDNALVVVDGLAYSVMPEIIASQAHRLRLIALIHHPLALETGLDDAQIKLLRHQETQALQHARHVVTTSVLTANSLINYGVVKQRVSAVLPGTDSAPLAKGSGSDVVNLLCVATITPRKAHDVLLDALASIKALPWHLYCAGSTERDNHTYESTMLRCRRHALQQRVTFCGELDDSALEQSYNMADVFVLASYHEGYGMVLSEAIARGLPIVCSDAGAMPQTVPKGAGLLVPPGNVQALADALQVVITDLPRRNELKTAACEARMRIRSWKQAAEEFAALLRQL